MDSHKQIHVSREDYVSEIFRPVDPVKAERGVQPQVIYKEPSFFDSLIFIFRAPFILLKVVFSFFSRQKRAEVKAQRVYYDQYNKFLRDNTDEDD